MLKLFIRYKQILREKRVLFKKLLFFFGYVQKNPINIISPISNKYILIKFILIQFKVQYYIIRPYLTQTIYINPIITLV